MKRVSQVFVLAFAAASASCQDAPTRPVAAGPRPTPARPANPADQGATPIVDKAETIQLEEGLTADVGVWLSGPLLAPAAPHDVRVLSFTTRLMQDRILHEVGEIFTYVDREGADSFVSSFNPVKLAEGDGLRLSTPGAGLGKTSGAYTVRLQPRAGLTWNDVAKPDDMLVSVEKAK